MRYIPAFILTFQQLVMPGEKAEIQEFQEKAVNNTLLIIDLSIPNVNVLLPSKQFFEVLYNRSVHLCNMYCLYPISLTNTDFHLELAIYYEKNISVLPIISCSLPGIWKILQTLVAYFISNEMPACRNSHQSMGGENSPNNFDLDLVTLTFVTFDLDLCPWPRDLWPWPRDIDLCDLDLGPYFLILGWKLEFLHFFTLVTLTYDLDLQTCSEICCRSMCVPTCGLASGAQTDRWTHTDTHTRDGEHSANAGGNE